MSFSPGNQFPYKYDYDQLQKQLDDTWRELDLEKYQSAHLKSQLKKYLSSRSDAPQLVSRPPLTTTPLIALSSHTALDQPPAASSSRMTLDKTPKKSFWETTDDRVRRDDQS